ncbi:MFS transporter [Erwinia billingiae]|uniref:MFS transporter n=1 Tax=Erwinia billingiae TaxID=182337 RepID=UPI00320B9C63
MKITNRENILVGLIFLAQVFSGSAVIMLTMISGLISLKISPAGSLVTLPNSVAVFGTVCGMIPFSFIINRFGWKTAIITGLMTGVMGCATAILSLSTASFYLYVLSCFLIGFMASSVQFYVFAATSQVCDPKKKATVVSLVMCAGLVSALISPLLVDFSDLIWAGKQFIGAFIGLSIMLMLSLTVFSSLTLDDPKLPVRKSGLSLIRLKGIERNALCGIVICFSSFSVMTLLMHGSPVAMHHHGYTETSSSQALSMHFIAMYAPALLTGFLITRFTMRIILFSGIAAALAAVYTTHLPLNYFSFCSTLVLIGIAWGILFISGTTILSRLSDDNKIQVQGFSNLLTYSFSAGVSFSTAPVFWHIGWAGMGTLALIPIILIIVCTCLFKEDVLVQIQTENK